MAEHAKSKRRKKRNLLVEHTPKHVSPEASNQYSIETSNSQKKKKGEASNHTCPTSMELPEEKQLSLTPPTHAHFSINKLTLQHEGSTLYDSFELRAMTRQLNKAIHGSNLPSPPYIRHLNSPLYRLRLDRIYKESAKTPRRISCSQSTDAVVNKRTGMKYTTVDTGGFVTRLWKKVKQGFLRNKQRKEG